MNFKKLCKIVCALIFLICFQGNALAATIHGTVYEWYSFKPLENSIVEINSTPEQYFVATNAEYSFNLTPGTYLINASYIEENTVVYETEEVVTVSDDGDYVHDLLLFPAYSEDLIGDEGFENVDLDFEEQAQSQKNSQNTVLIFALSVFCILLLAGYLIRKKRSLHGKTNSPGNFQNRYALNQGKPETNISESESFIIDTSVSGYAEPYEAGLIGETTVIGYESPASQVLKENNPEAEAPFKQVMKLPDYSNVSVNSLSEEESDSVCSENPESPDSSLPDDLKEIMDLIRANGNRITQRELRKKSPYSESKVSLMLSDLEERGLVEKFKKGRGNIIRIPDQEILRLAGSQERKE